MFKMLVQYLAASAWGAVELKTNAMKVEKWILKYIFPFLVLIKRQLSAWEKFTNTSHSTISSFISLFYNIYFALLRI